MFILYWNTNSGECYFTEKYKQTFCKEQAKTFTTEKKALSWWNKEWKGIGVNTLQINKKA